MEGAIRLRFRSGRQRARRRQHGADQEQVRRGGSGERMSNEWSHDLGISAIHGMKLVSSNSDHKAASLGDRGLPDVSERRAAVFAGAALWANRRDQDGASQRGTERAFRLAAADAEGDRPIERRAGEDSDHGARDEAKLS